MVGEGAIGGREWPPHTGTLETLRQIPIRGGLAGGPGVRAIGQRLCGASRNGAANPSPAFPVAAVESHVPAFARIASDSER